ncbi:uncharacterized protein LOC128231043 [Mya arenaria]|uniref:uncharacterized protein LOC128231043 n=1 Tax=Mya arenaria TaxID=6604 RepID=UPI0022E1622F|nr:uncharacterized protein LOC128231043 [Mya arenaria]
MEKLMLSLLDTFAAPGQFSVQHQGLHNHMNISSDSDSDDNAQDMPHFLQAHSANLLPGNGVHFTEPISTPIINQIPKSTRKDIWTNRFVDFASLLPSTTSPATPQYTLQLDNNSNISFQPTSRSRKITSIDTWTTAFIRFTAIYTAKFPFETAQLMKYAEIVRDIASRRPGLAFLNYDSQFRMLRQSVLLPWDRLHTEFWLMACTSFQQPTPVLSSPPNYNKHSQCRNSDCNFPHICGFCKGQHTAFNCKFSSKDEADKALNLRINPIGLVPKKAAGQFRMIHHLSYPKGSSVNDFIDEDLSTVNYSSFDDAVAHLLELGQDREIPQAGSTHGQAPHHSSRSLAPLNQAVYTLLESSLAPSTKSSYQNALKHYHVFHHTFYAQTPLLPVSAERLAQFIARYDSLTPRPDSLRLESDSLRLQSFHYMSYVDNYLTV